MEPARTADCAPIGFAISSNPMVRLIARGKYFFDGERKFYARGVSYGPFAPNSRGERYPELERAAEDFAQMREMGVNVVRTYVPPPPWMFDLALESGLRLMAGIPWPFHMAFLDSRQMQRDIREAIRKGVAEMREHRDALFAYTLGNEIRSDIVRWHGARAVSRFIAELHDIGKQLDPEGLFTYANYPSAEYLDLASLDFLSFNVYLHREADYRRYLTHLLAMSGDRPLVLSETGMDTIREGEPHQAELLAWQSRAAFELGLSGFIVFAYTDEWHTGGAEITDWAFGVVRRDRTRKPAFDALAQTFSAPIPAPLEPAPRASVIVAAYNAEATLDACLDSLKRQSYPDFETIVVDDGSSDATARIGEAAGVKTRRLDHRGLGAARNAGAAAASGEILAFLDADACADRDWLYHLVETMTRRGVGAAGGPNFPPRPRTALAAAIATAPGAPREVPGGDDQLEQLCGCNMALRKRALDEIGGFDPLFTHAGDDVDLSWRMRVRGETLASAPGATIIHERRRSIGAYLRQQRGYGTGEGLLFLKYPVADAALESMYGNSEAVGGLWSWLRGSGAGRIYYGVFGRGLFQAIYPSRAQSPFALATLSVFWVGAALAMIVIGWASRVAGAHGALFLMLPWSGAAALAISILSACLAATFARIDSPRRRFAVRIWLALLCLLGPLVRSAARERVRFGFARAASPEVRGELIALRMRTHGTIPFAPATNKGASARYADGVLDALRTALIRRGLAVARGGGFEPFDLQLVIPPAIRVPLNALSEAEGRMVLKWRVQVDLLPLAAAALAILLLMLAAQDAWRAAATALAALIVASGAIMLVRIGRVAGAIEAAAREAAALGGRS